MIINIKRKHEFPEGKTKAVLTIEIEDFGMELRDVKAIESPQGGVFFAFPSRPYEVNGEKKYSNYVGFNPEKYKEFQSAMSKAYKAYDASEVKEVSNHYSNAPARSNNSINDLPF